MSSGIKNKILNYEVTPPPGVWEKIAAELDESELHHSFPDKLYEATVAVPATVWNKIESALDADQQIEPKRRAIVPWFKYAAAAVIIGLVAWGGLKLLNTNKSKGGIAKKETIKEQPVVTESPAVSSESVTEQPIAIADKTDEARNDAALEYSKKTFAKLDMPSNIHKLSDIAASYSFASSNVELSDPEDNLVDERDPADINSRYIVLMTADGHFVRMAKKLSNMVCCVSGEEQDKDCIDQMSRWKEKMACSPTGHSTGSFLDILSLIKSLDDK